jgi:hypothetical protein
MTKPSATSSTAIVQCTVPKLVQVVLEQQLLGKCSVLREIEASTSHIPGDAQYKECTYRQHAVQ